MTGGRAKLFIHGTRRSEGTVCMTDRLQSHARAVRKQHSDMGRDGRILELWESKSHRGCDASPYLEKVCGATGFDPGTLTNHGFGVFTQPVHPVAFDTQINDTTERTLNRRTAD